MALLGFGGVAYFLNMKAALGVAQIVPFTTLASYTLAVIPLFILMGTFCSYGRIAEDCYATVNKWLGHLPGGLAMATIGGCAGFAAISGSSVANAVTMGKVAIPEMRKFKYDPALAVGCVAAGGTMGILIPPSTGLIIYAILVEESIGKLFIAGIIPGILEAVFYIVAILVLCMRNPLLGPPAAKTTIAAKFKSIPAVWPVVVLFGLVIGGIYFGIFSPTEAGGIGAVGALIIVLARRRLSWQNFRESLFEATTTTAMIFILVMGAQMMISFFALTRLPFELATIVGTLGINRYLIMAGLMVMYILLGMVMDPTSMIFLTVPVLAPLIPVLGWDLVWFGIITTRMVEIAAITPPVGIGVFIMRGVAPDVPIPTIFRGIIPFFIADVIHVSLLIAIPQLATFLPGVMR
jgi:tripartite ATP-independent transporter DctM subunit